MSDTNTGANGNNNASGNRAKTATGSSANPTKPVRKTGVSHSTKSSVPLGKKSTDAVGNSGVKSRTAALKQLWKPEKVMHGPKGMASTTKPAVKSY